MLHSVERRRLRSRGASWQWNAIVVSLAVLTANVNPTSFTTAWAPTATHMATDAKSSNRRDSAWYPSRRYHGVASVSTAATKDAAVLSSETETKTKSMTLFSPSKVNLFLRILRKREDGYHDLASLFQAIGFGDTLELELLESDDDDHVPSKDEFTCNMPGVPTDSSNLVIRALELMRQKTNQPAGKGYFQATLVKQVPAQAGLGGGSANAATAMFGANELLGRPATIEQVRRSILGAGIHIGFASAWSAAAWTAFSLPLFFSWVTHFLFALAPNVHVYSFPSGHRSTIVKCPS
jgi:hypothetical protein